MQKLRLIVVDCDEENCKNAVLGLTSSEIEVVGVASNGVECLDILKNTKADVILTELMMPKMDGYLLIDSINKMQDKPKVFVMSNIISETYLTTALQKDAIYYFFKPVEYSVIKNVIMEKYNSSPIWQTMNNKDNAIKNEKPKGAEQQLDEKISKIFLSIGIPAHIKGYQYLRYAIKEVMIEPILINNITKRLYPSVAEEFKSSPSKVERAIRHAIDVAWSRGKIDYINKMFGFKVYSVADKPTNGEFIALVADKLMCEYSDER